MGYDLKSIREEFKKNGVFYTPIELGEFVKNFINIDYEEVYDPTCGRGNLLTIFDDNIKKYGQELDESELNKAKELLINFEGYAGDTLLEDKFKDKKFTLIMANPPFSVSYNEAKELLEDERFKECGVLAPRSKADWMFNLHILSKLKDDGMALVINFPGILYRGNREGKIRKWVIEKNYIDTVLTIGKDKFVDTPVDTTLIIYRKNKKDTNVKFVNERGDEKIISLEEIKNNNFNLNVSNYNPIEVEEEVIDPKKLQYEAHAKFLKNIENELIFEKLVCEFENLDFRECLKDIFKIIKKFWREI